MKDIILREVAKEFCITEEEMFSRKRTRNIVYARQCAAFILKGIGFEYKEIAKILNQDRTTIYYYVKIFGYDLEKDTLNKQRYNNALQTMKILSSSLLTFQKNPPIKEPSVNGNDDKQRS